MGLLSAIGSIVTTAVSFISEAIPSIGSAIGGFAKNALSIMGKLPFPGLQIVAKIIHPVLSILGIKSEEDPEVLGAKAVQSDKSIDDFDNNTKEYINYLRNEVEFDKERFEKMTTEERMGCKAIGMTIETKAIEENIGGISISPECLATIAKIQNAGVRITPERLVNVVTSLKESGVTNMNDVVECLEGKGDSDRLKTSEALSNALGDNASNTVIDLQDCVRKYEED